jgi:hypothetical protein
MGRRLALAPLEPLRMGRLRMGLVRTIIARPIVEPKNY